MLGIDYYVWTSLVKYEKNIEAKKETYQMENKLSPDEFGINGIYLNHQYYCVWTEGRNQSEILRTDTHELCHDLVHKQHEHFCK